MRMSSIQDSCFVRKAFAGDLHLGRQQMGLQGPIRSLTPLRV
jgi:hypothetical protein